MSKAKAVLRCAAHLPRIRAALRRRAASAAALAETIADFAEPPMQEHASAAALEGFLEAEGFVVDRPWKGIPTAFRSVAGQRGPRIAMLAEYDALPDCGQKPGQWGHGCGHNLLGVASVLAGVVAADVLRALGRNGRIVVFGTPAEESLSGKVLMAEQNAFARLDAVLAWHPGGKNFASLAGGSAMDSLSFRFRGKTAHAAGCPEQGRSALDGALLTDVAVNYLREHIPENARIHCVIPDGGKAPNVVPDFAEIWYYVRGKDRRQVDALTARVRRCARGAAMATETQCRMLFHDAIAERIPNHALADLLTSLLRRCRGPQFTPADARAARRIAPKRKYLSTIDPINTRQSRGSTDEDSVSWFAPLGRLNVACVPEGTVSHHREFEAMCRLPGAHRGMLKAAEVLASAAIELALNAPLLGRARREFQAAMRGKKYDVPKRTAASRYGN
jgi:aminobenzoyl-glutamate utilization protein B